MKYFLTTIFIITCGMMLSAQEGLHTRNIHLPCINKNFNLYVHLSVDSTTRAPYLTPVDVDDLMEDVSKIFEPICLSVSSCEVNVIENYTFHNIIDSLRLVELEVLFGKPRRLNVYILGTIPDNYCGRSTYYGINQEGGNAIFLETDQDACPGTLAGKLAHHIGHFLGLADTYHGSDLEIVEDPNCEMVGDSICDTPTDPFGEFLGSPGLYNNEILEDEIQMGLFLNGCEFIHEPLDPNGRYYQPLVGNVMSAYPCKCGFTNGQFLKMVENYNKSEFKPF